MNQIKMCRFLPLSTQVEIQKFGNFEQNYYKSEFTFGNWYIICSAFCLDISESIDHSLITICPQISFRKYQ